ncbi:protein STRICTOSIDINE SYNTHASE-LIKE 5-like [Apium graveolens]|uniref:protein STRICTOSIDINE SYNTHASE-LIKE 5-like n=1 Tax=Apium graveolens TaxID=4045 RepID=UPI003D7BAD68
MVRNPIQISFPLFLSLAILFPLIFSVIWYQLDSFDVAPLPMHELTRYPIIAPLLNGQMLHGADKIAVGKMVGPEDFLYDSGSGLLYTGCLDGWIKRVTVNDSADDSVVEDWVNTGGRPLGLVKGLHGEIVVADAVKGLLKVSEDGVIELLTDSAEGQQFKITDGVDVAEDGIIYFTDASYKYSLHEFGLDILEGRPYGRLLSYNPSTRQTKVLVRDLYFANGVAVSPDQKFVVFCETPMRRCKKYNIEDEITSTFVDSLPGFPDNIRYDGEGHFWIGLGSEFTNLWHYVQTYPLLRKVAGIITKYRGLPPILKSGGAILVDLQGKAIEHYYDPSLVFITGAIKLRDHLYAGSIVYPYIIRLNVTRFPATSSA